jgi:hypothetical protein
MVHAAIDGRRALIMGGGGELLGEPMIDYLIKFIDQEARI